MNIPISWQAIVLVISLIGVYSSNLPKDIDRFPEQARVYESRSRVPLALIRDSSMVETQNLSLTGEPDANKNP